MKEMYLISVFIQDHSVRNYMIIDGIKYYFDAELSRKKTILCWFSALAFIIPLLIYFFIIPNYWNINSLPLLITLIILFILFMFFNMLYLIIAHKLVGDQISNHFIRDPNQN